jgi:hypothetical protein
MTDNGATDPAEESSLTAEVGDDGGSPGDVEIGTTVIGTGSEAGETWRPADDKVEEIVRDETGDGRRTP